VASDPTRDLDAVWGQGFLKLESFQRMVFADLSR